MKNTFIAAMAILFGMPAFSSQFSTSAVIPVELDNADLVLVDASSANETVNLPTASASVGKVYVIKKTDSSVNTVTIDPQGSELIDGYTTVVLRGHSERLQIVSDGSKWQIYNWDARSFTSYAPTISNFGSTSSVSCEWRRVDKGSIRVRCRFTSGATHGAGLASVSLPTGISVSSPGQYVVGTFFNNNSGVVGTVLNMVSGTNINFGFGSGQFSTAAGTAFTNASSIYGFDVELSIAQ